MRIRRTFRRGGRQKEAAAGAAEFGIMLRMNANLKTTLKAWPVITAVAIALCFATGAVSELAFGIKLEDQASIEQTRTVVTWLVKRLCLNAGLRWVFFKDLLSLAWMLAALVVVVPLFEEVVFRWILWRLPRPGLPLVPAITSSALFSAAHYIMMPWPNNAFVALFFFGMAQCWLYRKTDALWCPVLNHGLFNATNLVIIFAFPS